MSSWPTIDELRFEFSERYSSRWVHFWDLGLADPDLEAKFLKELGVGSGEREPADNVPMPSWHRGRWIGLLDGMGFAALANHDRFKLREIARVLGRSDQARALGLIGR